MDLETVVKRIDELENQLSSIKKAYIKPKHQSKSGGREDNRFFG